MKLWHGSLAPEGEIYLVRDASGEARCLLCGVRISDGEGHVARHPVGRWVVVCRRCAAAEKAAA